MVLRIIVIEKATAIKYIEAGLVEIPNFEAIDWPRKSVEEGEVKATAETSKPVRSTWIALLDLLTSMRPLTLYLLVFLNGFVIGGLIDR